MTSTPSIERFCVVALLAPLAVGDRIARSAWPAHVTLASNFQAEVSSETLVDLLRHGVVADHALTFRATGTAMFGPRRDIPVRLVESAGAERTHAILADRLAGLPGFAADAPAHWRDGYRPHVTLTREITVVEGQTLRSTRIGVARIDGPEVELVGARDIG
ncbi:MAG: 2'-5' RNA ligase family protein [Microbacterium enclense]